MEDLPSSLSPCLSNEENKYILNVSERLQRPLVFFSMPQSLCTLQEQFHRDPVNSTLLPPLLHGSYPRCLRCLPSKQILSQLNHSVHIILSDTISYYENLPLMSLLKAHFGGQQQEAAKQQVGPLLPSSPLAL